MSRLQKHRSRGLNSYRETDAESSKRTTWHISRGSSSVYHYTSVILSTPEILLQTDCLHKAGMLGSSTEGHTSAEFSDVMFSSLYHCNDGLGK